MLMVLCTLLLLFFGRIKSLQSVKIRVEDSQVAANLAAALMDWDVYDEEKIVVISSPKKAREIYEEALKNNLKLDEDWNYGQQNLICSPVKIEAFSIYHVNGDHVTEIQVLENGSSRQFFHANGTGKTKTPDGKVIENTTIYSRIQFEILALPGQRLSVEKECSVDIVVEAKELEDESQKND